MFCRFSIRTDLVQSWKYSRLAAWPAANCSRISWRENSTAKRTRLTVSNKSWKAYTTATTMELCTGTWKYVEKRMLHGWTRAPCLRGSSTPGTQRFSVFNRTFSDKRLGIVDRMERGGWTKKRKRIGGGGNSRRKVKEQWIGRKCSESSSFFFYIYIIIFVWIIIYDKHWATNFRPNTNFMNNTVVRIIKK